MIHLDLFSGIGGFALAVDSVWPNAEHIFCENDEFCQQVIKKHWPNSPIFGDIRTFTYASFRESWEQAKQKRRENFGGGDIKTFANSRSEKSRRIPSGEREKISEIGEVYLLTGGFPCQPFSQAGKRRGTEDDRYLWPEMFRVIQLTKPKWVIVENVGGLLTMQGGLVFGQVLSDLESEGYEVQSFIIPACAVNAPHRRDRVWIIANRRWEYGKSGNEQRMETNKKIRSTRTTDLERQDKNAPDTKSKRLEGGSRSRKGKLVSSTRHNRGSSESWNQNWLEVATRLCRVDDGLPRRMDRNPRLKALGNAIVPQVAEEIMKGIKMSQVLL